MSKLNKIKVSNVLYDIQDNTSGYITSASLPTKTSDLTNDGDGTNPFLTQHQSLNDYYNKSSVDTLLSGKENADETILKQANVVNNTTSTTTNMPLSANMGKELQTEINNLKNIGRFLAIWDASTGAPTSEPTTSPYEYKVGDYYRIGVQGTKNPAPNLTYTTGGTNWVEGDQLEIGDVVYCSTLSASASTWVRQASSGGGTVQDVQINGTTILNSGIANITDAELADVKYTTQSLTDTQKTQARTNIGALALEEYNSSATPVDNVLYYVVE